MAGGPLWPAGQPRPTIRTYTVRRFDPTAGELVFFQHDEVVVHTRNPALASAHISASGDVATRLMLGNTRVRFPMKTAVRTTYADDPE